MKKFYHATPYENLYSIIEKGILKGSDGIVYLAETPKDAAKFVAIRGCRDILVICVSLNESKVHETFDHSEMFFKCKAFGYENDIPTTKFKEFSRYEL